MNEHTRICPECDGFGEVESGMQDTSCDVVRCKECRGTGQIPLALKSDIAIDYKRLKVIAVHVEQNRAYNKHSKDKASPASLDREYLYDLLNSLYQIGAMSNPSKEYEVTNG